MWSSILCLSFISVVSAAPVSPYLNYLPHYGNPSFPSAQPAFNAPVSMEILLPPRFSGSPVGGPGAGPAFPTQGFIKYSLPKAPGRKSVEIFYPYDFTKQVVPPHPYMPQMPALPGIVSFDSPQQTVPQQQHPRAMNPMNPNEAHPQIMHDQPLQTGQTPTHA